MAHTHIEKTLVIIKPDGVARGLVGEVISRFERVGLNLIDMKMVHTTEEHAKNHYVLDDGWKVAVGTKTIVGYREKGLTPPHEDPIAIADELLERLARYMVEGPVIPMVWEGPHAVKIVRKLVGATEPFSSDVGTIRGDYVLDSYQIALDEDRSVYNLVHASGSIGEAKQEIEHWFKE
jgi:nucleoside-diphosphate kinase